MNPVSSLVSVSISAFLFASVLFLPPALAGVALQGSLDNRYGELSAGSSTLAQSLEIKMKLNGKSEKYKYDLMLSPMLKFNSLRSPSIVTRAFIASSSAQGKLYVGSNYGAAYILQADDLKRYDSSAFALEGVLSSATILNKYMLTPGLWTDQLHEREKITQGTRLANKITYIRELVPETLFLGISYIPRSDHYLEFTEYKSSSSAHFKNIVQLAASYRTQIYDRLNFKITAALEESDASLTKKYSSDLHSQNIEAQLNYMGFSLGASGGLTKKNHSSGLDNASMQRYWSQRLTYTIANFSLSLANFSSKRRGAVYSNRSLNVAYNMAKNIRLYTEFARIKLFHEAVATKTDCFMAGLQINF